VCACVCSRVRACASERSAAADDNSTSSTTTTFHVNNGSSHIIITIVICYGHARSSIAGIGASGREGRLAERLVSVRVVEGGGGDICARPLPIAF